MIPLLDWADIGLGAVAIIYLVVSVSSGNNTGESNAAMALLVVGCHRLAEVTRRATYASTRRLYNAIIKGDNITEPLNDLAYLLSGPLYYIRAGVYTAAHIMALLMVIFLDRGHASVDALFYAAIAAGVWDCATNLVEMINPVYYLTDGQFLKYREVEGSLASLTNTRGLIYSSSMRFTTAKRAILAACLIDGSGGLMHQVKPLIDEVYPEENGYHNMRGGS